MPRAVAHERKDTNFWAVNELADLMRDDPDGAWQIMGERARCPRVR